MNGGSADRLESWKEIAAYLGRNVRTVQRWERYEGLPVHRHHHVKLGSVYAYRHEIDAWRQNRVPDALDTIKPDTPAAGPAHPARVIHLAARRTAFAAMPMALVIVLVAFCGEVQGYQRGDIVRVTPPSGGTTLPDFHVIAVPGDRVRLTGDGLFVNGLSAGGLPPEVWRTLSGQQWEQIVPDGYFVVVSSRPTLWGLIPARFIGHQP